MNTVRPLSLEKALSSVRKGHEYQICSLTVCSVKGRPTENFTVRTGARAVLLEAQLTVLFKS